MQDCVQFLVQVSPIPSQYLQTISNVVKKFEYLAITLKKEQKNIIKIAKGPKNTFRFKILILVQFSSVHR